MSILYLALCRNVTTAEVDAETFNFVTMKILTVTTFFCCENFF